MHDVGRSKIWRRSQEDMRTKKRACDLCHRKKIQCDLPTADGPCDWCRFHQLECTFRRDRGRKKIAKLRECLGNDRSLEERMEQLEETVSRAVALLEASLTPSSTDTSNSPHHAFLQDMTRQRFDIQDESTASSFFNSPEIEQTSGTPHAHARAPGYRHLGQLNCHTGLPCLSDDAEILIYNKTGIRTSFATFYHRLPQYISTPTLCFESTLQYGLPNKNDVLRVLADFASSAFRLAFPVIDHVAFHQTVELAYEDNMSEEHSTAAACVLAFLSLSCRFEGGLKRDLSDVSDGYANRALSILSTGLHNTSLASTQAYFILYLYQSFSGRLQSAFMLHASACRGVLVLGGHAYGEEASGNTHLSLKERQDRQLRRLFWLCFMSDKDIALRTGQPPIMAANYCDLTPPANYKTCYSYLPGLDEFSTSMDRENLTPFLPNDPELTQIKDKACELLYCRRARQRPDYELLHDIRQLDNELDTWRLSIAFEFRPALSISDHSRQHVPSQHLNLPRDMRYIGLHFEYHHLITLIHRASEGWSCSVSEEESTNVSIQSSTALCLEASRSTLRLFKATVHRLAGESFWAVIFYLMSAVMTLFWHVIKHPLAIGSESEIELLHETSTYFRKMPTCKRTSYEACYIDVVEELVGELIELGRKAISRARREESGYPV